MPDGLDDYLDPAPATPRRNYDDLIRKHSARTGVDENLVRAIIGQESSGKPRALSPKGAGGLMQLMPATAQRFGVSNVYDPDQNIRGGTDYLKFLNNRYGGNVDKVLAGYNAGEGNVDKYGGIPPFRETQNYVPAVKRRYATLTGQQPQQSKGELDNYLDPIEGYLDKPAPAPTPKPRRVRPTPQQTATQLAQQIGASVMGGQPQPTSPRFKGAQVGGSTGPAQPMFVKRGELSNAAQPWLQRPSEPQPTITSADRPEIDRIKAKLQELGGNTHGGRLVQSVESFLANTGVQAGNIAQGVTLGSRGADLTRTMRLTQQALAELEAEDPNKGWLAAGERALPQAAGELAKMYMVQRKAGRATLPALGALSEADKGVVPAIRGALEGEAYQQGFSKMAGARSRIAKFAAGTAMPAAAAIGQGEDVKKAILTNLPFGALALAERGAPRETPTEIPPRVGTVPARPRGEGEVPQSPVALGAAEPQLKSERALPPEAVAGIEQARQLMRNDLGQFRRKTHEESKQPATPATPAETPAEGKRGWRDAVDESDDPFYKSNVLQYVARRTKASQELTDVLDRAQELRKQGLGAGTVSNVAHDVSVNPAATAEIKTRAQSLYEDAMEFPKSAAPPPPEPVSTTPPAGVINPPESTPLPESSTVSESATPTASLPETKTPRLALGVEAKAVEQKLTKGFEGLPEYSTVNVADQAKRATELLKTDPERAKRIAMGSEMPDGDLLPESVFTAVENHALKSGDIDTIRDLATASTRPAEASAMGQRIRMLAERNPNSAVTAIRDVQLARENRAAKTFGKNGSEKIQNEIRAEIQRVAPKARDWASFLEEIRCK